MISSLTHGLFRSVLCIFQIVGNFYVTSIVIREHILNYFSFFLSLLWLALWPNMWFILIKFHMYLKRMLNARFPVSLLLSVFPSLSLSTCAWIRPLTYYLDLLYPFWSWFVCFINYWETFIKIYYMIVNLSISPFCSINFCFIHSEATIGCIQIQYCYIFLMFISVRYPLFLIMHLDLKSTLFAMRINISAFF